MLRISGTNPGILFFLNPELEVVSPGLKSPNFVEID
jgi:hypothetical protein